MTHWTDLPAPDEPVPAALQATAMLLALRHFRAQRGQRSAAVATESPV